MKKTNLAGYVGAALAQVAALFLSASSCTTVVHGSCDGFVPNQKTIDVTGDVACDIACEAQVTSGVTSGTPVFAQACDTACGPGFGGCFLPDDYIAAFVAVRPDPTDAGSGACPDAIVTVPVTCTSFCEGRRTAGVEEPPVHEGMSIGDYFAACCYLEATSVHAFERLAGELEKHAAPRDLLGAITSAAADEVRHTALTRELALRFGVVAGAPRVGPQDARSLFELARENAIEGCIRETYGALLARIRSERALDAEVRDAMRSIADDEERHAELGWRIAGWAMDRLDESERAVIRGDMREAIDQLATAGDELVEESSRAFLGLPSLAERQKLAALLNDALFSRAVPSAQMS